MRAQYLSSSVTADTCQAPSRVSQATGFNVSYLYATVAPLHKLSLCSKKTLLCSKDLRLGFVLCSKCPLLFQNSVAGKIELLGVCFM